MSVQTQHLNEIAIFKGISEKEIAAILEASRARRVEEGVFFFMQDDPADHLYLLTEGRARLTQVTSEGQQVILHMIGPWEVFGLMAFVEGGRYPGSVEAIAPCQALSWDRPLLQHLVETYPRLVLNAMEGMAGHIYEFQNRIRELSTERVEQRLARLLLRLARQAGKKTAEGVLIDLSISRQDLAEMSGTTLYTVSRILSQWERQGLVDAGRERVLIRFPHGLVRIAEDLPK